MADPLNELLSAPTKFEMCENLFRHILDYYGRQSDLTEASEPERVVVFVWRCIGIVDSGGFREFFAHDFVSDKDFTSTQKALELLGCPDAAAAFAEALEQWQNVGVTTSTLGEEEEVVNQLDYRFQQCSPEIVRKLAHYIDVRSERFSHLVASAPLQSGDAASEEFVGDLTAFDFMSQLPHWARVAFAARCARRVFGHFVVHWPEASIRRSYAVLRAAELAERSAAQAWPHEELPEIMAEAYLSSACAFRSVHGEPKGEPLPGGAHSGYIASFSAKIAAKAAEAAMSDPSESLGLATEVYYLANEVADAAKDENTRKVIDLDLDRIRKSARQQRWSGDAAVTSEAFRR